MTYKLKTQPRALCRNIALALGLGVMVTAAYAGCPAAGSTVSNWTIMADSNADLTCGSNITINNPSSYGGYGVLANNRFLLVVGDHLTVSTAKAQWDTIRTNPTDAHANVTIGDYATIKATGSSVDAINVTTAGKTGSAELRLGNNAWIEAQDGMGVRVNLAWGVDASTTLTMLATVGDNATIITHGAGNNSTDGKGYAVYAGNRDTNGTYTSYGKNADVIIGKNSVIKTEGSASHAVYANRGGMIRLGDNTDITTTGSKAYGLYTQVNPSAQTNNTTLGGTIELLGDTSVKVADIINSYAMYSSGEGSIIASQDSSLGTATSTSGVYKVTGNLLSDKKGAINLNTTGDSELNSNLKVATSGVINLNMTNNSFLKGSSDAVAVRLICPSTAAHVAG